MDELNISSFRDIMSDAHNTLYQLDLQAVVCPFDMFPVS